MTQSFNDSILLLRSLLLILVQNLVHLRVRQVLVKVVIHLDCRSPTARANTFHLFQREQAVLRRAFMADAQLLLAVVKKLFATDEHTRDIGTHLYVVLPARL